jgi:nitrate reductase gamma subunit
MVASLIVPLVMVVAGLSMRKGWPNKVNWWAGYRTQRAKKNQETWVFAHIHVGKLFAIFGFVLILLSVGAAILVERGTSTFGTLLGVALGAQGVAVAISIISTETALRKAFDKDGNRRKR